MRFTENGSVKIKVSWIDKNRVDDNCFEPHPYDTSQEGIFEKDDLVEAIQRSPGKQRREFQ